MITIDLKRATSNDVGMFLAIEKTAAHLKTYAAIRDKEGALDELKSNTVYFIQKGKNTVGSIGYQMKSTDNAYVSCLVVKPQFQKQGIGRAAMTELLAKLAKVKRIELVAHLHNTPAIMLYLSLGFSIESWQDNYFGDGEPRTVLAITRN